MATSYLGKKQSFKPNITFNRKEIADRIFEVIFEPEDSYVQFKELWKIPKNVQKIKTEIADSIPNMVCQNFADQVWEYIGYSNEHTHPSTFREFQNQWIRNWYFQTKSMKKTLEMYIESEFYGNILNKRSYGTTYQNN